MSSEIGRRRQEGVRPLPPMAVNRASEYYEKDLAYRVEFTVVKTAQIGRQLIQGITELHDEVTVRAGDDLYLEQLLRQVEGTVALAGCELIARYMNHPFR